MSDIVTFPLFVTANEYDTRSVTRETVAGVALLTTDNAGAFPIVTIPKEKPSDTTHPQPEDQTSSRSQGWSQQTNTTRDHPHETPSPEQHSSQPTAPKPAQPSPPRRMNFPTLSEREPFLPAGSLSGPTPSSCLQPDHCQYQPVSPHTDRSCTRAHRPEP